MEKGQNMTKNRRKGLVYAAPSRIKSVNYFTLVVTAWDEYLIQSTLNKMFYVQSNCLSYNDYWLNQRIISYTTLTTYIYTSLLESMVKSMILRKRRTFSLKMTIRPIFPGFLRR